MERRRLGFVVGLLGILVLGFYLVVRLAFMERLDAAVAGAQVHSVADILANLSWPLVVFLAWAYSFRVGTLLVLVGGALHAGMGRRGVASMAAGGLAYLATCYVPFVGYSPRYYGILGTAILVMFVSIAWGWMRRRPRLPAPARVVADLRMAGYYFLVVATWGLCGIFGIVTYALHPAVMLERGLQPTAVMLTGHVMAELTLGWFLVFLASRKEGAMHEEERGASIPRQRGSAMRPSGAARVLRAPARQASQGAPRSG